MSELCDHKWVEVKHEGFTHVCEKCNQLKPCTHKDENGNWTVIVDGQYEECVQCGLIGK